jgi:hypothetical protein
MARGRGTPLWSPLRKGGRKLIHNGGFSTIESPCEFRRIFSFVNKGNRGSRETEH